ncbi:MAG: glycosyltransferase family 39 protein, partial [Anaerolineales bacterium]|nr:glycosyltransferase family 39 protein [Anaerolineales bacterium]
MKRFPTLATPNYILLLAAALLPRLMALGRYVTPDELAWVERSIGLRRALLAGDWAATIQSGHPGVTTSWLGAIGIQLQLWLQPAGQASLNWLETLYWFSPDNQMALRQLSLFLSGGRLLVILTTSLGILLVYRLSRPLLGDGAALIGGLLLALDPFTAGLSGLLHLDALLATFALLAVLA